MKINSLFITNKDLFLCKDWGLNCEQFMLSGNLGKDIESIGLKKVNLIILALECFDSFHKSHLFGGLEFLLWLRVKGINTHAVVLSFFSLQGIQKINKQAFILGSKGITFVQLPINLHTVDFKTLVTDEAENNNLKSYFIAIFDLVHFRHAYANVWGLKRIIDMHNHTNFRKWNKNLNYAYKEDIIISNSLNYNIGKYLYAQNETFQKKTLDDIYSMLAKFKNSKNVAYFENKTVLIIDDNANNGWTDILKDLFPEKTIIKVLSIGKDYGELEYNFIKAYKDNKCLLVLLDLRLHKFEDQICDYNNLMSVKLLKKMLSLRNQYNHTKHKYQHLRFILFTASNQLHNLLDAINDKYIPYQIFIKEGFDISENANQQAENYLRFLVALYETSIATYRNSPLQLESHLIDDQNKIERFTNLFENGQLHNEIKLIFIKNHLAQYTHIIPDTNIFLQYPQLPLLKVINDLNVLMIYPVCKELEKWPYQRSTSTRLDTIELWYANLFLIYYMPEVESLKDDIDSGKFNLNFIADDYFVPAIQYFSKEKNSRILFVTNDLKPKDGKPSPFQLVETWIKNNNIENVDIAEALGGELKIHKKIFSPPKPIGIPNRAIHIETTVYNEPSVKTTPISLLQNKVNYEFSISNDKCYLLIEASHKNVMRCVYIADNTLKDLVKQSAGTNNYLNSLGDYNWVKIIPKKTKEIDGKIYKQLSSKDVLELLSIK